MFSEHLFYKNTHTELLLAVSHPFLLSIAEWPFLYILKIFFWLKFGKIVPSNVSQPFIGPYFKKMTRIVQIILYLNIKNNPSGNCTIISSWINKRITILSSKSSFCSNMSRLCVFLSKTENNFNFCINEIQSMLLIYLM